MDGLGRRVGAHPREVRRASVEPDVLRALPVQLEAAVDRRPAFGGPDETEAHSAAGDVVPVELGLMVTDVDPQNPRHLGFAPKPEPEPSEWSVLRTDFSSLPGPERAIERRSAPDRRAGSCPASPRTDGSPSGSGRAPRRPRSRRPRHGRKT